MSLKPTECSFNAFAAAMWMALCMYNVLNFIPCMYIYIIISTHILQYIVLYIHVNVSYYIIIFNELEHSSQFIIGYRTFRSVDL